MTVPEPLIQEELTVSDICRAGALYAAAWRYIPADRIP